MRIGKLLADIPAIVLLASCSLAPLEEASAPEAIEQTSIKEESSLFTADLQSKIFTFETNDKKYLGERGFTLWTVQGTNGNDSFEPVEVKLCKESGRAEAGFGIVFCEQETEGRHFMLAVLINTSGYYTAGKVTDGEFSHINGGWKSSSHIKRGHGIKNTVAVTYDSGNRNFLLRINGYNTAEFTAPEGIPFKGSRRGFAAVIASNEDFPETPVRVTFEAGLPERVRQ